MGVFYLLRAPAFVDDLPIDFDVWQALGNDWKYIEDLYHEAAVTCFIAMGCYILTFTFSVIMVFVNRWVK